MKEFVCPAKGCVSKVFILTRINQMLVDFSMEGAIEGHPHLQSMPNTGGSLFCGLCHARVPLDMTKEMIEQII